MSTVFRLLCPCWFSLLLACSDTLVGQRHPTYLRVMGGDQQIAAVGSPFPLPLAVQVLAADTLPLAGVPILFRVTAGAADIAATSAITDQSGRAETSVTATRAGNVVVVASVYSSSLSASFLLSGSGAGDVACARDSVRLLVAEVRTGLGGSGVCLTTDPNGATYVLVAFASPGANLSAAQQITLTATGVGQQSPSTVSTHALQARRAPLRADPIARPSSMRSERLPDASLSLSASTLMASSTRRPAAASDTLTLNTNLLDACTNPRPHTARVVARANSAILVADDSNPPGAYNDAAYAAIASAFDTLVSPADTLNFKAPTDIDRNGRVILFFTRAVNEMATLDQPDAVFLRRDLFSRDTAIALSGTPCSTSNEGELLYIAVPDSSALFGSRRTRDSLVLGLPRQLAHVYQHLINASRRAYVNFAASFEEPWLDEALSDIAEELLFQRASSRGSRENLGSYDITLTSQSATAFRFIQRNNIERYAAFLASAPQASPFAAPSSLASRGAGWSLLRYLADHRYGLDYVSWTDLVRGPSVGMENLAAVFGSDVRFQMRDWAVAQLTDDLFASAPAFSQPSWNFRSIFALAGPAPYPLAIARLADGVPKPATLNSGGAAFFSISVPPSSSAVVRWSGSGGVIPPLVQWTLVRVR